MGKAPRSMLLVCLCECVQHRTRQAGCARDHVAVQGFDSPQHTQLSAPKSPEWHPNDIENKENALPDQSSTSKQLASPTLQGDALLTCILLPQAEDRIPVLLFDADVALSTGTLCPW